MTCLVDLLHRGTETNPDLPVTCVIYYSSPNKGMQLQQPVPFLADRSLLYPLEPPPLVSQNRLQNCTRLPVAQAAALASPTLRELLRLPHPLRQ